MNTSPIYSDWHNGNMNENVYLSTPYVRSYSNMTRNNPTVSQNERSHSAIIHDRYNDGYNSNEITSETQSYPIFSMYETQQNSTASGLADHDPTQFISKSSRIN